MASFENYKDIVKKLQINTGRVNVIKNELLKWKIFELAKEISEAF